MRPCESGSTGSAGSVAGRVGGVSGPDYVASKIGVHGLIGVIAHSSAAEGVYGNAVAPGPVWPPMTEDDPGSDDGMAPLNRLGKPEAIAETIAFLSGQGSNWITGTALDVNGGISVRGGRAGRRESYHQRRPVRRSPASSGHPRGR